MNSKDFRGTLGRATTLALAALAVSCAFALAPRATHAADRAGAGRVVASIPPDRGDLALAYLRFDAACAAAPRDTATRERLNRAFDALTADFFAGRTAAVLAALARFGCEVEPDDCGLVSFVSSHRVGFEPRIVGRKEGAAVTISCRTLEGVDGADGLVRAAPPEGTVWTLRLADGTIVDAPFAAEATLRLGAGVATGPFELALRARDGRARMVGRGVVLAEGAEALLARFRARLDALVAGGTLDPSTTASLAARLAVLAGDAPTTRGATIRLDPARLIAELDEDLARAERGERPFAAPGERWRIVRALGTELPVRQFVPPPRAEADEPGPLVVAFHGAGGDENMFFDGYGAGTLLALAKREGFTVVCPPTVPFGISPTLLERFLDELAKDVAFDRARVLLVGHSLGAVTASRLAVLRPDLVAGAACIAGFTDLAREGRAAPRHVFAARLDPLFDAPSMRSTVDEARARGQPLEWTELPHEGHTLVVGEALPQAIAWLFALPPRTAANTKPTASAASTSPMKTGVPAPDASVASPSPGPTK
ncbi:MAG: hypothetical protein RI967_1887 [Planctomycetota bacterium]